MKKYLFFDMDGTVCDSKQVIKWNMLNKLKSLKSKGLEVIVISGQSIEHMNRQLAGLECPRMPQSGNITDKWNNSLSKAETVEIYCHMSKVRNIYRKFFAWKRDDFIENRGCQISLSFMGHGATYHDKINFDPVHTKRQEVLYKVPFMHPDLMCTIAGTTCLDYTRKDGTKGKNIAKYIEWKGWNKDECVYFGDALFRGGNDESVIGVIDIVDVFDPEDLLVKLEEYGKEI